MILRDAIDHFLHDRAVLKDLRPITIYNYLGQLRNTLGPLRDYEMGDVSGEHIKATLSMHRRRVSQRTYSVRLGVLKLFSRWAHHEYLWPLDYLSTFYSRQPKQEFPRFLDTSADIMEMASRLDPLSCHDIRDRAMLLVSYAGALRPSELFNLRLQDYLPTHNPPAIHVKTLKRGHDRYVLLFPQAQQALDEYLSLSRDMVLAGRKDLQWMFPSNAAKRMNHTYWWKKLNYIAIAAGVRTHVSPHTLRHSAATHLAQGGMTLWELQAYLGHASPMSTAVYVHMLDRDVINGYKSAMPLYRQGQKAP